jgi:hypothetical protein
MLRLKFARVLLPLVAIALGEAGACFGDTIDLGFVQFIEGSDTTAGFNILNETGPNSSVPPDTSFPVVTSVSFSNLDLFVNFADGSAEEFPPTSGYFTLSPIDNLSFTGQQESGLFTDPISSAILAGTFGVTTLTLNDGSVVEIDPSFVALVMDTDPSSNLLDGDFALITATTSTISAVPEPGLAILLACGLAGLAFVKRASLSRPAADGRALYADDMASLKPPFPQRSA